MNSSAALAGTAALGAFGAQAASATGKAKVVVVGGGYGGATAARYLREWSGHGIEVTLVEPNASLVSCPLSNLVLAGSKRIGDITLSYEALAKRHGVSVVRDHVARSTRRAGRCAWPAAARCPRVRRGAVARRGCALWRDSGSRPAGRRADPSTPGRPARKRWICAASWKRCPDGGTFSSHHHSARALPLPA
ncbi:FAD-dependent oxidoreductase [Cupriavidus basilensis]